MSYLGQNEPTPSEIRASHRKAVGGKRDRCNKGKSCSAACIERKDRCLVDFPEPASRATTKVRDKVSQLELFPTDKYVDKKTVEKISEFKKKVERGLIKAVHLEDEDKYNRHRQEIIDFNKRLGERSSSALKVPATWERMQNVRESYEKAKGKLVNRLEKAAKKGDRIKYQEEEKRLLKIRRDLGVKVGDTAKYLREEIWYRLGGGLKELEKKQKPSPILEKTPRNMAKDAYEHSTKMLRMAARMGNRDMFDIYVNRIQKLREKVKAEGIPYRVGGTLSWEKATKESKDYDKKFSGILRKVEKDAASGNTRAANKGVEALYKLHLTEGSKFGDSFPLDKVEMARRGGSVLPLPTPTRLYPIRNTEEFRNVARWTGTISRDFHDKLANVFNMKEYYGSEERGRIMERLGIGESTFAKLVSSMRRYTGTYYEIIKDAHKLLEGGKVLSELSNVHRQALSTEKSINRFISAFPKEEIPKFRGGRMSDDRLADLIASSRIKGEFKARGITSWSSDLGVAQRFADDPPGSTKDRPNRVILQTVNKMGVPIESITTVDNEMELLTSGRARYRHTGVYNKVEYKGETYHIFEVIER